MTEIHTIQNNIQQIIAAYLKNLWIFGFFELVLILLFEEDLITDNFDEDAVELIDDSLDKPFLDNFDFDAVTERE